MLSLIPPSTLTYVRMPSTSLTVPTSYRVNTDGPTIARPGSMDRRGLRSEASSDSDSTILLIRHDIRHELATIMLLASLLESAGDIGAESRRRARQLLGE